MSPLEETYMFDASNYPGFEKARALEKRLMRPDPVWYEGLGVVVIFISVIIWFVFSGGADEEPLLLVLILAVAAIVTTVWLSMLFFVHDSPNVPVRISADGHLVMGDRRWAVSRIGKITAFGNAGAVEIREKDGHVMALPYRAQFGSFDDFVEVLHRLRPDIDVTRDTTNVKVRVPKDSM